VRASAAQRGKRGSSSLPEARKKGESTHNTAEVGGA